ncbi:MAG TPA: PIN domain-containing protein [Pyrinomonadaceae bacterium]|nr:PIN domain-containing protein [Pyrinomonadaceae bacterium]
MSRAVFVDSAAWIALLHSGDSMHARAVEVYRRSVAEGRKLLTSSLVLVEVASAFASPAHRHLALELAGRYRGTEVGELVWVDEDLCDRGWKLYGERSDKGWSLVDCVSFILMRERGIAEALTSDHHFEQAGFRKLL